MSSTEEFIGYHAVLFVCLLLLCIFLDEVVTRYRVWWLPASVTFIIIGFLIGLVTTFTLGDTEKQIVSFNSSFFFFGFLPPIVFEAGYTLKRKNFFENFGTILAFAVPGTLIAAIVFAYILYGFASAGTIRISSLISCLMFGSLISATDTVAIVALISTASASSPPTLLSSLILGESVLNDAVSVVLYSTFRNYAKINQIGVVEANDDVGIVSMLSALGYFIGVSLGSIAMGVSIALICCFICKRMNGGLHAHTEFSVVALFAYMSYSVAEIANLSGIMAIFFCSVCLAHYNYYNLSASGKIATVETFKSIARVAETFVFLFLGMTAGLSVDGLQVNDGNNGSTNADIVWSAPLIFISFFALLIARACSIFPLSFLANLFRSVKIPFNHQVFLWFAGLRGAIAFAIAMDFPGINRPRIVSTTLALVVMTSVLFGCLTKPVLSYLKLMDSTGFRPRPLRRLSVDGDRDRDRDEAQARSFYLATEETKESATNERGQKFNSLSGAQVHDNLNTVRRPSLTTHPLLAEPALLPSSTRSNVQHDEQHDPLESVSSASASSASASHHHSHSHYHSHPHSRSRATYSQLVRLWKRFDASFMKKHFGGRRAGANDPIRTGHANAHQDDLIQLQLRVHGHTHTGTDTTDSFEAEETDEEQELETLPQISNPTEENINSTRLVGEISK